MRSSCKGGIEIKSTVKNTKTTAVRRWQACVLRPSRRLYHVPLPSRRRLGHREPTVALLWRWVLVILIAVKGVPVARVWNQKTLYLQSTESGALGQRHKSGPLLLGALAP